MSDRRAQGVVNFKVTGDVYRIDCTNVKYNLGHAKREPMEGGFGYTLKPQNSWIEVEMIVPGDLEVEKILKMCSETVILEHQSGKVITIEEAWVETDGDIDATAGKLSAKFVSDMQGTETLMN